MKRDGQPTKIKHCLLIVVDDCRSIDRGSRPTSCALRRACQFLPLAPILRKLPGSPGALALLTRPAIPAGNAGSGLGSTTKYQLLPHRYGAERQEHA